jgi:regulator of cell morphogenesis and NO signaling
MPTLLSPAQTVRQLATDVPNATRIFEQLGIDYCCGGGKSLSEACAQARLSVDDVLRSLEQGSTKATTSEENADFQRYGLRQLVEHIVDTHHSYVKQEIPRIQKLLAKVAAVHGKGHAELVQMAQVFAGLGEEMTSHMMKEEMVLFPYISELESAIEEQRRKPFAPFGKVSNPVQMMEMEHESAGGALRELRALSSDYTPPQEACFSYRTLFSALETFEKDLHQHIHLENNILFPKAEKLEAGN